MNFEFMLNQLVTESDPIKINQLAVELSENGDPRVLPVLLELIQRSDMANNRATLVHCLNFYRVEDNFLLLINLIIEGNWEVAHEAFSLINSIEHLEGKAIQLAYESLTRVDFGRIENWRQELLKDLQSMFR